jgi:hypothetical protein
MKSDVDSSALQEVLEDLETRLEAYLAERRRDLGIQERPEAGIDRKEEQRPGAAGSQPSPKGGTRGVQE